LLVGSGGATPARWAAPLVIAACGLSLLVPARSLSPLTLPRTLAPRVAIGRLATAVAVVIAIAAVMIPVSSHLPGVNARSPYVLRAAVGPPPLAAPIANPLSSFAAIHDGAETPIFTVHAPGANLHGVYWRLTVLDGFDGSSWAPRSLFRPAGSELPSGPRLSVACDRITARVTVYGPTTYLPAPDRPFAISLPEVNADQASGVLAAAGELPTPLSYQVRASIPHPGVAALINSSAPTGNVNAGAPAVPEPLASLALGLVRAAQPTPWDRLLKLRAYLTGNPFTLEDPGASTIGSGYFRVSELIRTHHGTSEQYAAAFAVLARAVGFHTRLGIGYLIAGSGTTADLTYTTRDLTVWPEVLLDGIGWLPIPVDPATGNGGGASSNPAPSPVSGAIDRQNRLDNGRPPAAAGTGPGPIAATAPVGAAGLPAGVIIFAGLVLAILAAVVAIMVAKLGRSRRQRRNPDPGRRLAGAWEHVLDRLVEFGVPLNGALTAREVSNRAVGRLGEKRAAPVGGLVPFVDAARYDRRFPPTRAAADAAWGAAGQLDASLRSGSRLRRRMLARVSVAPFRRH
ncbi:MAG: DUF3488 and transglutaminase-like domain-containing protein, partial [Actinomycetota bacterium]|nr:DUF3488 and transglutaminase-like domain-containing protein [Actinomycetota bacterium]